VGYYECEWKWDKNLKSGLQPTPETSCILSMVSTMVNAERNKSNTRKCNCTTGSVNWPVLSASSTALQARNQLWNIWWSGESTHFSGLVVLIYANTMLRELQSLELLSNSEVSFFYVPVWVVSHDGRFRNWPGYLQRTAMLASTHYSYLRLRTRLLWHHVTPELNQCRLIQLLVWLKCNRTYFIRSFLQ
jgi:hypothetical protein